MDAAQPPVTPPQSVPVQPPVDPAGQNPQPAVQSVKKGGVLEIVGTILTIGLLIVFFPLGLLSMWFFTKWPKVAKIIITLFFLVIGGILTVTGFTVYRGIRKAADDARNRPGYVQSDQSLQPKGIGLANAQKGARNELRKLDVDTMAKVLELHYSEKQAQMYLPPQPAWFAARKVPQDPAGGGYQGVPATDSAHFNICANLEDVTPSQYCKQSLH